MREWIRDVWADMPARISLLLALVTTIPAWFIWSGEPLMEAIDALVIAGFLATLWVRDLIGTRKAAVAFGLALAVVGLALEAAFYVVEDERPHAVALIFPAGLLLMIAGAITEHRRQAGA